MDLTKAEQLALEAYTALGHLTASAATKSKISAETSLEAFEKQIIASLAEMTQLLHDKQTATPAFWDYLHMLYMAYEVNDAVVSLTRDASKGSEKLSCADLSEQAKKLQEAIHKGWVQYKDRMDESGWIDQVIESVAPSETEIEGVSEIAGPLKSLIGEDFLEERAGELVDSWRESIAGLTHLKML